MTVFWTFRLSFRLWIKREACPVSLLTCRQSVIYTAISLCVNRSSSTTSLSSIKATYSLIFQHDSIPTPMPYNRLYYFSDIISFCSTDSSSGSSNSTSINSGSSVISFRTTSSCRACVCTSILIGKYLNM